MIRFGKPEDNSKHEYFEDRLSAYLDGELAPQEQGAVESHLATCQACQWDLDTLQRTIQWTSELPTVPLPRVFTIPAPAQPEPAKRRRWNFVPVLQGATALVALLLFFAVAGDLMLGSRGGVGSPELMYLEDQAPAAVQATQVVQEVAEAEVAAAPAAEIAVEEVVVETVVVEKEMVVEAVPPAPQATQAAPSKPPAPAAAAEESGFAAAPEESVGTESPAMEGEAAPLEKGVVGEAADESQADAAASELETRDAVAGGIPTPTVLASPQPLLSRALEAPTTIAEAEAPAPAAPEPMALEAVEEAPRGTWREPGVNWLRAAELSLAITFLLLLSATILFSIRRRRAG